MLVIRPFRHQGANELAAALTVLRVRPIAMALCVAAPLLAAALYRRAKWASVTGIAILCGLAALSHVNIYERMFHPIGQPAFENAAETKLASDEKVIAVSVAGEARAYPVRSMSYHHMVNDRGGRRCDRARRIERSVTPVWCGGERWTV